MGNLWKNLGRYALELFTEPSEGLNDSDKGSKNYLRELERYAKGLGFSIEKKGPGLELSNKEAAAVEYIEGRPGGKIEIPDSGIHGRTAYMARHELLDGACRPENEVEHAMLEEQNLMGLEKEGSYGVLGHGLLMHDVRNKHNPGPFKAIRGTVDRMVKKYRKWVEKAREEILSLYPHEHAYFRA